MIVSHTAAEATLFVDGSIRTDEQFTKFLEEIFPEMARTGGWIGNLTAFYPPTRQGE
jgi:hypothetical protein